MPKLHPFFRGRPRGPDPDTRSTGRPFLGCRKPADDTQTAEVGATRVKGAKDTVRSVIIRKRLCAIVENFIRERNKSRFGSKYVLVIVGPPGSGKTFTVDSAVRRTGARVTYLDTELIRSDELMSILVRHDGTSCVVLDGVEAMGRELAPVAQKLNHVFGISKKRKRAGNRKKFWLKPVIVTSTRRLPATFAQHFVRYEYTKEYGVVHKLSILRAVGGAHLSPREAHRVVQSHWHPSSYAGALGFPRCSVAHSRSTLSPKIALNMLFAKRRRPVALRTQFSALRKDWKNMADVYYQSVHPRWVFAEDRSYLDRLPVELSRLYADALAPTRMLASPWTVVKKPRSTPAYHPRAEGIHTVAEAEILGFAATMHNTEVRRRRDDVRAVVSNEWHPGKHSVRELPDETVAGLLKWRNPKLGSG